MRKYKVFHVDAFTNVAFGGNPAGVVPEATGLSDVEMQKIAKELNLSETAFLIPCEKPEVDFRVRYFTPSSEIDFCGHATLASAWILATKYFPTRNLIKFETNIGLIPIEFLKDMDVLNAAFMTQVEPEIRGIDLSTSEVASMIGVDIEDLDSRFPIKLGYTGNWHLFVPIKTREAVDKAKPLFTKLEEYNRKCGVATTHLFTFDTEISDCYVYTRDFAPNVGIPEDPVTGSANGALAGYFILEKILDARESYMLKIAQGHTLGRPGYLDINIDMIANKPVIKVGGQAVPTISGVIQLP